MPHTSSCISSVFTLMRPRGCPLAYTSCGAAAVQARGAGGRGVARGGLPAGGGYTVQKQGISEQAGTPRAAPSCAIMAATHTAVRGSADALLAAAHAAMGCVFTYM